MDGEFRRKGAAVALGPPVVGPLAGLLSEAGTGKASPVTLTPVQSLQRNLFEGSRRKE